MASKAPRCGWLTSVMSRMITELPTQDVLFMDRKTKKQLTVKWNQKQVEGIKAGKKAPMRAPPQRVDTPPKQRIAREHKAITDRIEAATRHYDESYGMLNEEISIMADTAKKDWFVEMLEMGADESPRGYDARRQRMAAVTREMMELKDGEGDFEIPNSQSPKFGKYLDSNSKSKDGNYLTAEYTDMFQQVSLRATKVAAEGEAMLAKRAQEITDLVEGSRGDDTEEIANEVQNHIEGVLAGVRSCGSKLGATLQEVWGRMDMYRIQLYGQEEEIKECRQKMMHFSREMAELGIQVREEEQDKAAKEMVEEKSTSGRTITKLQAQVDSLVRESKDLRARNESQGKDLKAELLRMTEVAASAEHKVEDLELCLKIKKEEAAAQIKEVQIQATAALQAAQAEAETATARGLQLGRQVLELEQKVEELKGASAMIEKLDRNVRALEAELETTQVALQEKVAELAAEKAANASSGSKIAAMQEELDSALADLMKLEQTAEEAQASHLKAMQDLNNEATAEKEKLSGELAKAKKDLASLAGASDAHGGELTQLKQQLAAQKVELQQADGRLKQAQQQAQAAAAQASEAQSAAAASACRAPEQVKSTVEPPCDVVLRALEGLRGELKDSSVSHQISSARCALALDTKEAKGLMPGSPDRNAAEKKIQATTDQLNAQEVALAGELDNWRRIAEMVHSLETEISGPKQSPEASEGPPASAQKKAREVERQEAERQEARTRDRPCSVSVAVQVTVESDFAPVGTSSTGTGTNTSTAAAGAAEAKPKVELVSVTLEKELQRMMQICSEESIAAVELEETEANDQMQKKIVRLKLNEIDKSRIELQKLAQILADFEQAMSEGNSELSAMWSGRSARNAPKKKKKIQFSEVKTKFAADAAEAVHSGIPMKVAAQLEKVKNKLDLLKDSDTAGMVRLAAEVRKTCSDAKGVDASTEHGKTIQLLSRLADDLKLASNNKEAELAAAKADLRRAEATIIDLEQTIATLRRKINEGKSRAAAVLAERRGLTRIHHDQVFPGVIGASGDNDWAHSPEPSWMNDEGDVFEEQTLNTVPIRWDSDTFVTELLKKRESQAKKSRGRASPSFGIELPSPPSPVFDDGGSPQPLPAPPMPWMKNKKNKSPNKMQLTKLQLQQQHALHEVASASAHVQKLHSAHQESAQIYESTRIHAQRHSSTKLKALPAASPADIAAIQQALPKRGVTPPIGAAARPESRSQARRNSDTPDLDEKGSLGNTEKSGSPKNERSKKVEKEGRAEGKDKLYTRKDKGKDKARRGVHSSSGKKGGSSSPSLPRLSGGISGADALGDGMTADEKVLYMARELNAWEDPEVANIFA